MPYSFVWLYLIKCVFTCSIFVDSNTKWFLSVLGVFGKYFVFTKTEIFKNSVALFWWLSCGSDKAHVTVAFSRGRLWLLVRKWKVQSRGVHRDFRGSALDSLASETSSREKHLTNFFKNFWLEVFWRLALATCTRFDSVAKNACFAQWGQFFKTFFSFPLNFLWLFTFSLNWN